MRINPNHPGAATAQAELLQSTSRATKGAISPAFARFKAEYGERAPEKLAWTNFRRLARAMFGGEVFKDVKGVAYQRLDLGPSHLRHLAEHPGKIEEKLRASKAAGKLEGTGGLSMEELAKLYSRSARAAVPASHSNGRSVGLTIATVNDDFTDRKTNLRRVHADVVLAQEAKNTHVRKVVSKENHGVHQNFERKDKAGAAVIWHKDRVQAGKRGYELAVRPDARADMLNRWMSWVDVKVDGVKVRMISVHRPPGDEKRLWPAFDRAVARFVKQSKIPVVIGLDANDRTPTNLVKLTGLKWRAPKGSIDGFLVSPGITVEKTWRLPKGSSDHHPVMAKIRVRRP